MIDEKFLFLICFIAFVALIFKPAKRAILGMIDSEIARIKTELDRANVLRADAEAMLSTLKQEITLLEDERKALLVQASDHAQTAYDENMIGLENLIARKERDMVGQLEYIKDEAVKAMHNQLLTQTARLTEKYTEVTATQLSDVDIAQRLLSKTHDA